VSGPLFEQYKSALRRGHLSALAGMLDDALEAYVEASRLAPERPLPFANQATILHRLDRWPEAAEAFDHALGLAPEDEATLRARATAREARGMQSGAAADFERLALVLDVAGQRAAALEAARRAGTLEGSPARTELLARLTTAAAAHATEPAAASGGFPSLVPPADPAALDAELAAMAELVVPDLVVADAPPVESSPGAQGPGSTGQAPGPTAGGGAIAEGSWPAVDLPSPPPSPIEGPPPDPDQVMADAATALEAGDLPAARDLMLTAIRVHRSAGHLDAALDCCLQLLAVVPGEPQVHLAIANLQLDHGWTALATEKIELLLRLTALTGDTQAEADAHGLAAERLRDEPAPPVSVG
jgi:tetratricopeptide (TPR) repeat protein